MSCGMTIPGYLGRLHAQGIRLLWPEALGSLPDKFLYGSLWATRESAQMSNDLNEANHGHAGRTYGPMQTDLGWATAIDLRQAMVAAEGRADVLKGALDDSRGERTDLAAFRRRQR